MPLEPMTELFFSATSSGADPQRFSQLERRPYLLYVEDEIIIQRLYWNLLAKQGFKIDTAGESKAALSLYQTRSYDVVVLDATLPQLSGYHVARLMRDHEHAIGIPSTPIILLTLDSKEEARRHTIPHRIEVVLHKHSHFELLLEAVRYCLTLKGSAQNPTCSVPPKHSVVK